VLVLFIEYLCAENEVNLDIVKRRT